MEFLIALLPLIILVALAALAVLALRLVGHLLVTLTSKRLRAAKRAAKEFHGNKVAIEGKPIEVYGSARSKKDFDSWDFVYQRNHWIAEHQELIADAAEAHRINSELHGRIVGELSSRIEALQRLSFPLRRLEARKLKRILEKMSWPRELVLSLKANYRSPAGRINLNDIQIYSYDLEAGGLERAVASSKVPLIFDNPKALQFPGVYVYSYPHFMEGKDVFPVKIGKSESSVHARVRQQIAQGGAAIPEDPIIICAIRLDQGAGTAEALLHSSFRARRTKGGGTEWFTISLKELRDELTARKYSSTWNKELGSPRYQGSLRSRSQS